MEKRLFCAEKTLIENDFELTHEGVHGNEYQRENVIVYIIPSQTINVVVSPQTAIDVMDGYVFSRYHSTALRKYPKRKNRGEREITYGYQVKFDDLIELKEFLNKLIMS